MKLKTAFDIVVGVAILVALWIFVYQYYLRTPTGPVPPQYTDFKIPLIAGTPPPPHPGPDRGFGPRLAEAGNRGLVVL